MKKQAIEMLMIMLITISLTSVTAYGNVPGVVNLTLRDNHNPNPPVITGPPAGKIRGVYSYNFTLTDPDGDGLIQILIEWGGTGDGNTTFICWICDGSGPKPNGTIFVAEHSWITPGNYTIRAKVWDTQHNESEWGTLSVTMPFSHQKTMPRFFELLFQRFPHGFPLLRHLMGY